MPSSGRWKSSGMGGPIGRLTLNTSEWPSDAAVCSLSDILEANPDPKFSLSAKACQGILNRAAKRERNLPAVLESALREIAEFDAPNYKWMCQNMRRIAREALAPTTDKSGQ